MGDGLVTWSNAIQGSKPVFSRHETRGRNLLEFHILQDNSDSVVSNSQLRRLRISRDDPSGATQCDRSCPQDGSSKSDAYAQTETMEVNHSSLRSRLSSTHLFLFFQFFSPKVGLASNSF